MESYAPKGTLFIYSSESRPVLSFLEKVKKGGEIFYPIGKEVKSKSRKKK
jgi:hypothetical protein